MNKFRLSLILTAIVVVTVGVQVVIDYFHGLPVYKSRLSQSSKGPDIGGPFTLVDHTGRTVTSEDFSGRYRLVYFGYTFCPDVCPTALQTMMSAYAQLSPKTQAKVVPLFITVDPQRDTVERMQGYIAAFHPALIGLSGTVEQTTAAAKAYKAYFAKVKQEDDKPYLMDHSSIIYLMDPEGRYHAHFGHGTSAQAVHDALAALP